MGALCLVTGATGYIGGRLVPALLDAGLRVRVLARHPERLRDVPWAGRVEVVAGDAQDPDAVRRALTGVDVAYYLLHSLQEGAGFEDVERRTAEVFGAAARDCGVDRIVYLGGLAPTPDPARGRGSDAATLSPHLRSRVEVGAVLRASGVPTAELRAAVIIGSGSASFEMLRYLTERLPAMVTPRWVRTRTQPIAIRDVLRYLVGAAGLPPQVNRSFDIGGPDVLTYEQMMQGYARVAGLRPRVILPVNVLTPGLSSHWVGLVTPVPRGIARPLVESLRHETVCREHDIARWIPDPPQGLVPFERAVSLALQRIREADVVTRWSDASVPGAPSDPLPTDPHWTGGSLYQDVRVVRAAAPAQRVWAEVERIGGEHGYHCADLLWEMRGLVDRAVGGVGLRRGRRDPDELMVGDALDFWRVEARVPPRLLRLRAEMRLPGLAWLEWTIAPRPDGGSTLRQRALFHPRGLAGHAYWWSVAPFHGLVFPGMARHLARAAERAAYDGPDAADPGRVRTTPSSSAGRPVVPGKTVPRSPIPQRLRRTSPSTAR